MRVLRVLGGLLLLLLLVLGGFAAAARFSDGPVGVLPGGPLTSGPLVPDPVADWSFATDVETVELQLLEPPRSRTVWILVHERRAYIPCNFLGVPLWKQWPHEAVLDGRGLVRIDGKRYEVHLQKVDDAETFAAVNAVTAEKYDRASDAVASPEAVWVFRLDSRTP